MNAQTEDVCGRPISLSPACDETNVHRTTSAETWLHLLGGIFLVATGIRQNSFSGGIVASFGSCLAYRGAVCLLGAPSITGRSPRIAERPDPAVVDNPVDEASWESFPASDSPVFSGITK
jgi:uncharacterized membrane protein